MDNQQYPYYQPQGVAPDSQDLGTATMPPDDATLPDGNKKSQRSKIAEIIAIIAGLAAIGLMIAGILMNSDVWQNKEADQSQVDNGDNSDDSDDGNEEENKNDDSDGNEEDEVIKAKVDVRITSGPAIKGDKILVSGQVLDSIDESGTCTYYAIFPDGTEKGYSSRPIRNTDYLTCESVEVPISAGPAGTWQFQLVFDSPTASGGSEGEFIDVKK